MKLRRTAEASVSLFAEQGRLIRFSPNRTVVFVGDTHGDIDATERILTRYVTPGCTIVFLGDTVDRGPSSRENLELILRSKLNHPTSIYLLMGNHEAWGVRPFMPADFWENLDSQEERIIANALANLPFAAHHPSGVLGLHGAFPDVSSLDAVSSIELGSMAWEAITWGDWIEDVRDRAGEASARPTFRRADFDARASKLGIQVLVRSHQPLAPMFLFEERCLTVFSSNAYGKGPRSVAILRPDRNVKSARDLEIETID
jgi:hypothetical protein